VEPAEDRDRIPRIDTHEQHRGKVVGEVSRAGRQGWIEPAGLLVRDIVHLREALSPQELFRHVLGG
jgi:hypothetical protein